VQGFLIAIEARLATRAMTKGQIEFGMAQEAQNHGRAKLRGLDRHAGDHRKNRCYFNRLRRDAPVFRIIADLSLMHFYSVFTGIRPEEDDPGW
jgi:hypothetical protein